MTKKQIILILFIINLAFLLAAYPFGCNLSYFNDVTGTVNPCEPLHSTILYVFLAGLGSVITVPLAVLFSLIVTIVIFFDKKSRSKLTLALAIFGFVYSICFLFIPPWRDMMGTGISIDDAERGIYLSNSQMLLLTYLSLIRILLPLNTLLVYLFGKGSGNKKELQ